MKVIAAATGLLCMSAAAEPGSVQLFNTDVLGKPTSTAVVLFAGKMPGEAEPYVVWTDVSCGRYIAASAFYRKPIGVTDVVEAINGQYSQFKVSGAPVWLWRVTDKRFTIQVAEEKEAESVRVTYMSFAPVEEPCPATSEAKK